MNITLEVGGRAWQADLTRPLDISIPLDFSRSQPSFFGAPRAHAEPLRAGTFTGEVRTGGSCNCSTYSVTPHCNGTHTESVGHITVELHSVQALVEATLLPAQLVTVPIASGRDAGAENDIVTQPDDRLITAHALSMAASGSISTGARALIIRTLPNPRSKRTQQYDREPAAYFTSAAMNWIVAQGVQHLIVDVPSLDRANDDGRMLCHRIYWGMPARAASEHPIARPRATVTEMAYVPDEVLDGCYLLNLQIAPFVADAAPSRPLLYPLVQR
ncbi:MAG: cyclase family protein [Steroidobacteraceae bacterium]